MTIPELQESLAARTVEHCGYMGSLFDDVKVEAEVDELGTLLVRILDTSWDDQTCVITSAVIPLPDPRWAKRISAGITSAIEREFSRVRADESERERREAASDA